jgi:hypothetical protein
MVRKKADIDALAQWLSTGGEIGNPPSYYFVVRAARFLNVAVWELEARPDKFEWIAKALTCDYAELKGQAAAREIEEKRQKMMK